MSLFRKIANGTTTYGDALMLKVYITFTFLSGLLIGYIVSLLLPF